jgi:hypothetical protein
VIDDVLGGGGGVAEAVAVAHAVHVLLNGAHVVRHLPILQQQEPRALGHRPHLHTHDNACQSAIQSKDIMIVTSSSFPRDLEARYVQQHGFTFSVQKDMHELNVSKKDFQPGG